jgi:SNF2 family DNA or RNA helicase
MMESFDLRRALVVAPLRVARKVWKDELKEWSHLSGLTISCMTGTWAQKFAALKVPADIHTINRESLPWLEAQFIKGKKLLKRWPWDLVVPDESQSFRNQGSERWKSLNRLRHLFPYMAELTGSCAPGGYHNLWAQAYLLDRGKRLGATEQAFLDRWFQEPTRDCGFSRPRLKEGAKAQIQAALSDIVLSMRAKDYLDLPPVHFNPVKVELPPAVMKQYKKFAREYVLELKSQRTITAVNAGVLHGKLLQLAGGAIYTDDKGNYELLHDEKLKALEELLETCSVRGPVLIGTMFKSDRKRIAPLLDRFCGKDKVWKSLKTDAHFDLWAAGEIDIGELHPASAGHGLNDVYKSGCQDLIWFNLSNDYELFDQLNKRLTGGHRVIGRDVRIHMITAEGTQDEETYDLLTSKAQDQDDLTDAMAKLTLR